MYTEFSHWRHVNDSNISLCCDHPPPPPPPPPCSYTAMKALAQLVHETNDLAGQRELIAESLESEVMEPLKGLARDIATERKKHMAHGNELLRQLKASMDTLERVCVCVCGVCT